MPDFAIVIMGLVETTKWESCEGKTDARWVEVWGESVDKEWGEDKAY